MAFNNFGVQDQVKLLRETVNAFQGGGGVQGAAADRLWETVLGPVVGRVAQLSGFEFKPGPEELLDLASTQYGRAGRTRAFRFAGDTLDCSEELLEALEERDSIVEVRADSSVLEGGHLTPVVISLKDVSQAAGNASGPVGQVAGRMGERFGSGSGSFRFGNEAELEALLDELVAWAKGGSS